MRRRNGGGGVGIVLQDSRTYFKTLIIKSCDIDGQTNYKLNKTESPETDLLIYI